MICKYCNSYMIHSTRYSYYGSTHLYRCPVCHAETHTDPLYVAQYTYRRNPSLTKGVNLYIFNCKTTSKTSI